MQQTLVYQNSTVLKVTDKPIALTNHVPTQIITSKDLSKISSHRSQATYHELNVYIIQDKAKISVPFVR